MKSPPEDTYLKALLTEYDEALRRGALMLRQADARGDTEGYELIAAHMVEIQVTRDRLLELDGAGGIDVGRGS